MARKKTTPSESSPKDIGANDKNAEMNSGGNSGGKAPAKRGARKTPSPASNAGKPKGASDQMQTSINEEEARVQEAKERNITEAPDGTKSEQQRGSSRRSSDPPKERTDAIGGHDDANASISGNGGIRAGGKHPGLGKSDQKPATGAAEKLPSGRSPDQRSDEPNGTKAQAKRGRKQAQLSNQPELTDQVDPEHASPIPETAVRASQEAKKPASSETEGAVPAPLIPGEIESQVPERKQLSIEDLPADKKIHHGVSLLTDFDIHLFKEGKHFSLYEKLGAHQIEHRGTSGTLYAVWAPNAEEVSVMGDFNQWDRSSHPLQVRNDGSGIWEGFVPGVGHGQIYKYNIKSRYHMYHVEKADPFSFARESPPQTASVVNDMKYEWKDQDWMQYRNDRMDPDRPYSVYEMHLGSWRRKPEDQNRPLTFRELAQELPQYLKEMGFTHLELMPIMYHPFNGSWGYQITGYFAAASQYGSPQDLMHLIDALHQHGIGVILDWVPSHFPSDEHGLVYFDGTHLFEHADARKGFHPDWNSYIFNYGRNEVKSFLISNALFWLDKYHADGLRVDAVASMLYNDYSRKEGEWIPNEHGGRENLEAITLLKELNMAVHAHHPGAVTIAEESTAWPGVTNKVEYEGLGFDMKWMMGWMHDTLNYFGRDPIYRKHHQGEITFSMMYAFSEKFMLPLSHDEVVHGKGSLITRMPGDDWQRFANLRLLFAYMYGHPGKKLLYMGSELAQYNEWNHDSSLDWHLLQYGPHAGIQHLVRDLNHIYMQEPALHAKDFTPEGFEWIDYRDEHNSVMSFVRKGRHDNELILVVCNFTPVVHHHYRMGVPRAGRWEQIFTSDHSRYGGSGFEEHSSLHTLNEHTHGRDQALELKLPPLGVVYYKFMDQ